MIRSVDYHPQANVLTRSHAEWRHQRFQGTEADSTFTPVCESTTEEFESMTYRRDPNNPSLPMHYPRTVRDTRDTTYEWWSTGDYEAAEEQRVRRMLEGEARPSAFMAVFEMWLDWMDGNWPLIALLFCLVAIVAAAFKLKGWL